MSSPAKNPSDRQIAYFSMEIGLDEKMPNYCGGLGILAGDTLKSCADLGVPIVGVTLLSEQGYFHQKLDSQYNQVEEPELWHKENFLTLTPAKVVLKLKERNLVVRAWEYVIKGINGAEVPVYFLDTNFAENDSFGRELTSYLYGGNLEYRLYQELILGVGGLRVLQALGYDKFQRYHLNEGHSALLLTELCRQTGYKSASAARKEIASRCIFTTHTPLPDAHDRFPRALVEKIVPKEHAHYLTAKDYDQRFLDLTLLALNTAGFINGVARRHKETTEELFPGYHIHSITNGVHSATWTSKPFAQLYDKYLDGWQADPASLRYALSIPNKEIWQAHLENKRRLIDEVNRRAGEKFTYKAFTVGIARRLAPYKRPTLILSRPETLKRLARKYGGLQLVFAGKAFPSDMEGEGLIKRIFAVKKELAGEVPIVFLEDYDIGLAKILTAGCDLWLNTPIRPLEASGTSGMKAALNGVPQASVLDGWWLEGHLEGVTGWTIGPNVAGQELTANHFREEEDEEDLYFKLEEKILPTFYHAPERWQDIMRHTIAFNASFFNTTRMVQQYLVSAYN